jgi:hypothetical protein
MYPPDPTPPPKKNWTWIIVGAIALLCLCVFLVLGGSLAVLGMRGSGPLKALASATPKPTLTPTPAVNRSYFTIYLRYIPAADHDQVDKLFNRLQALGYNVERQDQDSFDSWSHQQNAILYGDPACLDAIADLLANTGQVASLSGFELIRYSSGDAWYTAPNIVIQLVDNTFVP